MTQATPEFGPAALPIVVAGNTVLDVHVSVDGGNLGFEQEWAAGNVCLLDTPPQVVLGGNGAATSYTLAKLGIPVRLNSTVGEDSFGELVSGWLESAGVELVADRVKATAVNWVQSRAHDGCRIATFYTGDPVDWSTGIEDPCAWFFASGYGGVPENGFVGLMTAFDAVKSKGGCVAFDPGPWFARLVPQPEFRDAMERVDLLTGTEKELLTWSVGDSVEDILDDYLMLGPQTVIVKRGPEGASYGCVSGERGRVEANPVEGAHAVGAGDTFNGALIAALYRDAELEQAVNAAVRQAEAAVRSGRGVLGAFEDQDLGDWL